MLATGAPASFSAALTLDRLAEVPGREERLVHRETLPPREARHASWPAWVDPLLRSRLEASGVDQPWTHQIAAADAAHHGRHVVVATGTASGKSLAYLLPGITAIRAARGPHGQRGAAVLYLSPTKALAQDQLDAVRRLDVDVRAATHDGDSTPEERSWTRDHAELVLTNPDMLHRSLLPTHERWTSFFRSLRYVVVDECHHYRGVFGAHVALVLRRLRRICALHGAHPTFVLASATVAEPAVAAERLVGAPVEAVTDDGSPRDRVVLGLWQPPRVNDQSDHRGEHDVPLRRSTGAEMSDLLTDLVVSGVRTLAFVRSRRGVETVSLATRRALEEAVPGLGERVAAYRGGYLPEDRRALEAALRDGSLLGLAATNALELGIDIAGLDAVLIGGFPGTRAALWQQIGRAGRGHGEALGVFVARDDPLDAYLVEHPEALLGAPVEASVFDPANPYVLGPHLCAAAAESPLTPDGLDLFGASAGEAVEHLTAAGLLRRRPHGWFWTDRRRACDLTDIRSTGGPQVRLVEETSGRVIGTVDAGSAHGTAHTGAVYLHQGETWFVVRLDLDEHVAVVRQEDPGYSTSAREVTDIAIEGELRRQRWGEATLSFGDVRVAHQVVSYVKRSLSSGELLAEEPLDLPAQELHTKAVWWTLPDSVLDAVLPPGSDRPGAAHAAEHASIGLLPLFATCDRWDIGGVSTELHPDTGRLTVFVHDGHPGGAGFAEHGYATARAWLTATREAIAACRCAHGCPSCVQSPKCGNGNEPLDKAGAVVLLDALLSSPAVEDVAADADALARA